MCYLIILIFIVCYNLNFSLPFEAFKREEGGHDARSLTGKSVLLVFAVVGKIFAQTVNFGHRQSTKAGSPVRHHPVGN